MSGTRSREQRRLLQYNFSEFFTEHLLDVSRVFEGDLQMMLVLAVMGQAYLHGDERGREQSPISASRLADVTGIPRQTVRRKLVLLAERGWVEQTEIGAWVLTKAGRDPVARTDLADVYARGTDRLVALVKALRDHV